MTPDSGPEARDDNQDFATADEARAAIQGLGKTDLAKLMLIARGFARTRLRGTVTGAEDLLQDAIAKTLDGRRRWNRRVTMIKHLDRVMESDAGHEAERRVARAPEKEVDRIVAPSASEARLVALGEIQEVLSLFADDRPALELLRAKGNGLSASEVQRTLGIGASDYETIAKRIRRRFARRMAAGDK